MARRPVINREELFEAANTMAAEGKDVTALAILNALGGGSLTTIYKYLSEWESGRPQALVKTGSNEIPEVIQNAFASTWRVATIEASKETIAVKEQAAEAVKAAQKQFHGAVEAIQKLEADSEQDAAQIEELKKHVSKLEAALTAVGNDKAALTATVTQLQEQVKAQGIALERAYKDGETERKRHHDELTRLNAEREVTIKEAAQLQGQMLALREQNKELLDKLAGKITVGKQPVK